MSEPTDAEVEAAMAAYDAARFAAPVYYSEDACRSAMRAALAAARKVQNNRVGTTAIPEGSAKGITAQNATQLVDPSKNTQIPEGWQLVPVEPTAAMLEAGREAQSDCLIWSLEPGEGLDDFDPTPAYRAMLAAAPKPPGREE